MHLVICRYLFITHVRTVLWRSTVVFRVKLAGSKVTRGFGNVNDIQWYKACISTHSYKFISRTYTARKCETSLLHITYRYNINRYLLLLLYRRNLTQRLNINTREPRAGVVIPVHEYNAHDFCYH